VAGLKAVRSLAAACAAAGAAWAVIALFFTVRIVTITGALGSGAPYATAVVIRGYNTIGGWVLVVAGVAATLASADLLREKITSRAALGWVLFTLVLLACAWIGGAATLVAWMPGIPAEIQHAIGTNYVTVTETAVSNIPAVVAIGFILSQSVVTAAAAGIGRFRQTP
jgi:hypothetical protein